jgi:hypothetical protein
MGSNTGSVFTIGKSNLDIDVKLAGITIRGGSSKYGAGVNNFGRLTVEGSSITGNNANKGGGGIYNENGVVTINDCNISGNGAAGSSATKVQ